MPNSPGLENQGVCVARWTMLTLNTQPSLFFEMRESDLYRPVRDYLELRFCDWLRPAYGDLRSASAITATAGGARTGQWSKPDLALVALWRTKYALAWSLDL